MMIVYKFLEVFRIKKIKELNGLGGGGVGVLSQESRVFVVETQSNYVYMNLT